jgi:hypothetical protein
VKSTKEILKELGFNAEAPLQTQKAFLRHLVKAAQAMTPISTQACASNACTEKPELMTQLEFDLSDKKRVS